MDKLMEEAKLYVTKILGEDSSGHDDIHCFRVYRNALMLANHYDVDLKVISLAALLHDLDDPKISKDTNYAKTFLDTHHITEKDEILDIIANLSFSSYKVGKKVSTLEGKIVQDADRLDALGAVGIARCFAYSGYMKRPLYKGEKDDNSSIAHFYQKLFKLPNLMNLPISKNIANDRVKFMRNYLEQFYVEWGI